VELTTFSLLSVTDARKLSTEGTLYGVIGEVVAFDHPSSSGAQQHPDRLSSVEHLEEPLADSIGPQQGESVLPSMTLMMAAAHPTPD
jgi:hypothetical protein